jgi:hypothetical protein
MLLPSTPPATNSKKKHSSSLPQKCKMLMQLGTDYLTLFGKNHKTFIPNYSSEEHIAEVIGLIQKVLEDDRKTEAIEISITFYLLYIRSISSKYKDASEDIFKDLCGKHKISGDAAWVCGLRNFSVFLNIFSGR